MAWRGFAATLVAVAAGACLAALAFLVVLDPYDTGRLFSIDRPGVAPTGPRIANASRARDDAFDAAIIGNSHVQLLTPERLNAATGARFVSLIVPASYPREQFVIIDWFLRHHRQPKALVIGADNTWCRADATYHEKPFPFWLYERSELAYLRGLLNYSALEAIPGRVLTLRGIKNRARRDGYWDYEPEYLSLGYGDRNFVRTKLTAERPTKGSEPIGFQPAEKLRDLVAKLPPETKVVIVHPPRYINFIPVPGSDAARLEEACLAAYRAVAASRPNVAIVDWYGDRPENRDPENFFDRTHYRHPMARAIEADIAAAINGR